MAPYLTAVAGVKAPPALAGIAEESRWSVEERAVLRWGGLAGWLGSLVFIGVCVEFVAAVAWLAELFPDPKQREKVLGYTQAFSSIGGLLVAVANGIFFWSLARDAKLPESVIDGLKGIISSLRTAFPDLTATVDEQIAEGDKVVSRFIVHATHDRGELMGLAPSGKELV